MPSTRPRPTFFLRSFLTGLCAFCLLHQLQPISAFTLQPESQATDPQPNTTTTPPLQETPKTTPNGNETTDNGKNSTGSQSIITVPPPPSGLNKTAAPPPTSATTNASNVPALPPPPKESNTPVIPPAPKQSDAPPAIPPAPKNSNTTATVPPPPPVSPLVKDPTNKKGNVSASHSKCPLQPLTPATWTALKIDDYLKNYPGGKTMNLIDYATSKNASNFVCDIGSKCNIGQPCFPVTGLDWYVLFAVQQWNIYMNNFYLAVGYALSMVQSSISALLASIFPAVDQNPAKQFKSNFAINAGLTEVTGTVMMDVMVLFASAMGPVGWAFNVLNFVIAAAMGFTAFAVKLPSQPIQDGFGSWSNTAYFISNYEQLSHDALAKTAKKVLDAGISTDDGLYGTLKGGKFLSPATLLTIPEIEDNIRNVTLALSLNMILHSLNAFVTVGSDPCTDKGKNGAWPQNDVLSWCDKPGGDGTMYNIIRYLPDGKSGNNLPNANILSEEYGYSTELITQVSVKCQEKHGGFSFNPYTKGNFPKDITSDCVFNLPVCFVNKPEILHKIHKKGKTTAEACKGAGGLPL